jgi:hypothetical protein
MQTPWWRRLLNTIGVASQRKRQPWTRTRLQIELLEDRVVPSTNNVWTDAQGDGLWNTAGDWSLGHVPVVGEIAEIAGASALNPGGNDSATISGAPPPSLDGIQIDPAYTNTVTDSIATFTLGTSGFVQDGGAFAVTGSSAILVAGDWTELATFNAGSGTVTFNGSGGQNLDSGGQSFNNVSHTGSGALTLLLQGLTVGGTLTNASGAGNFDANGLTVTVTGLTTVTGGDYLARIGTQSFNGGLTVNGNNGAFTGDGGAVNATDVTLSSGTLLAPSSAGAFNVSGNWAITGGTFNNNSGTVVFDGASPQTLNSGGASFNDISHTSAGLLQLTTSDLTVGGTLTNSGAGNFDANTQNVTVTGLTTISNGAYLASTGTQSLNGGLTVNGGTFTGAGGTVNTTNVSLSSGALTAPSATLHLTGNWANTGGTLTANGGTVNFDGNAGTQSLNSGGTGVGSQFNIITHTGTALLELTGNALQVNGTLTNSGSGNFDANGQAVTVTGLTTVTAGTYLARTGTQTFNGGLTVNGGIFTGDGGTVSTGDVSLSSGTLTAPSGTFDVAGNWANTGGTFTPGNNTVTFDGAGTQTLNSGGTGVGFQFNNLSHTGAGLLQLTTNDLQVNGTLANSGAGNFDANTQNVTVTGLTTISNGAYLASTGTQSFNGGLTVNGGTFTGAGGTVNTTKVSLSSGALTAPAAFNVSGNWSNSGGTFSALTSTVTLTGAGQSISGANTFYNLTKTVSSADTLTFGAGAANATTVAGTLILEGLAGQLLSLRSAITGTQWQIDPQGPRTVQFVDVKDSKNTDAIAIQAASSTNAKDNRHWAFFTPPGTIEYASQGGTVTLKKSGSNLELLDSNNNLIVSLPVATANSVTVDGEDGATNTFVIDYTGGAFTLPGGIAFNGGASGVNTLQITGGSFTTDTYNYTDANDGSITLDTQTISYTQLTPILNSGTAANVVLNLPTAGANVAVLEDSGGSILVHSNNATFEDTTFANPSGSLTINRGAAGDTIDVTSANLASAFTIGASAAPFATATIDQPLTLNVGAGALAVNANTINVNAAIDTSGGSAGAVSFNEGTALTIAAGATINASGAVTQTGAGAVSLAAGITTAAANVNFASAVSVNAAVQIATSGNGPGHGDITFSAPVNDANAMPTNSLTLQAGTSNVTLAAVGNINPLLSLSATATGATTLGASVTANNVTLTGNVTLAANVDIAYSGAAALSMSGGTVSLGSHALTLTDNSSITTGSIASQVTGGGSLTKAGPGTLTLSDASNTYGGGTTITSGILSISSDGNLGAVPASAVTNITMSGGELKATANVALSANRNISLTGTATIQATILNTLTIGGIVSGAFTLTLIGPGNVSLLGGANISHASGDGIDLKAGGDIRSAIFVIDNSTIANNTGSGIQIFQEVGSVTIADSAISTNTASSGAGISVSPSYSPTAVLTLNDDTLDHNHATAGNGGAISIPAGSLAMTNVTLDSNTASGNGGGIFFASTGALSITNATIANNAASNVSGFGGGLFSTNAGTTAMVNTIVAANSAKTDPDVDGLVPAATGFNNLIGDGTGLSAGSISNGPNDNQVGGPGAARINPLLATLAYYGGPAQLMTDALLPGSPALDAGADTTLAPYDLENYDERGGLSFPSFVRKNINGFVDIGAFESLGFAVTRTGANALTETPSGDSKYRGLIDNTFVNADGSTPTQFQVTVTAMDPNLSVAGGVITFEPVLSTLAVPGNSDASATLATPPAPAILAANGVTFVTVKANNNFSAAGSFYYLVATADSANIAIANLGLGTNNTDWKLFNQKVTTLSYAPAGAITAASNTSQIVITSAAPHGLVTGQQVTVSGVLGNSAANTPANATYTVTVLDATHFRLNGVAGNGTYGGGGIFNAVALSLPITGASNTNPIVITSPNNGLVTNEQVTISGVLGNTNANGLRTVTVLSGAITSAAGGHPITITSAKHGLATGDTVIIAGNSLAAANGPFTITVTGVNTFTLNGTSAAGSGVGGTWTSTNKFSLNGVVGNGAYTSGGSFTSNFIGAQQPLNNTSGELATNGIQFKEGTNAPSNTLNVVLLDQDTAPHRVDISNGATVSLGAIYGASATTGTINSAPAPAAVVQGIASFNNLTIFQSVYNSAASKGYQLVSSFINPYPNASLAQADTGFFSILPYQLAVTAGNFAGFEEKAFTITIASSNRGQIRFVNVTEGLPSNSLMIQAFDYTASGVAALSTTYNGPITLSAADANGPVALLGYNPPYMMTAGSLSLSGITVNVLGAFNLYADTAINGLGGVVDVTSKINPQSGSFIRVNLGRQR